MGGRGQQEKLDHSEDYLEVQAGEMMMPRLGQMGVMKGG